MKSGLKDIELYDAQENCLSFHVRSRDQLRDALTRYVENPQLAEQAPTVRYDP
jgi:hypothetical protein